MLGCDAHTPRAHVCVDATSTPLVMRDAHTTPTHAVRVYMVDPCAIAQTVPLRVTNPHAEAASVSAEPSPACSALLSYTVQVDGALCDVGFERLAPSWSRYTPDRCAYVRSSPRALFLNAASAAHRVHYMMHLEYDAHEHTARLVQLFVFTARSPLASFGHRSWLRLRSACACSGHAYLRA